MAIQFIRFQFSDYLVFNVIDKFCRIFSSNFQNSNNMNNKNLDSTHRNLFINQLFYNDRFRLCFPKTNVLAHRFLYFFVFFLLSYELIHNRTEMLVLTIFFKIHVLNNITNITAFCNSVGKFQRYTIT